MKKILLFGLAFLFLNLSAQNKEQEQLCTGLKKIFESGIQENFESITGMNDKQSPVLKVPGNSIHLPQFPTIYVDKDNRLVGRHGENYDSLTALKVLTDFLPFFGNCFDTANWKPWTEIAGDDLTTVFFKEEKEFSTSSKELNLTLAMVRVANKVYDINLYIKRKK